MIRLTMNDAMCSGRLCRREVLRIGGLAGLSMLAPGSVAANDPESASPPAYPGFGRAKSVILVFANGGQSQLDTWDPKPEAPHEVRGDFEAIRTSVPDVQLCEHLPRMARAISRCTIVRSMSHEDLDHGSAVYLSMTGQYHTRRSSNPLPQPTDYPVHGGVLKRVRPSTQFVHTAVHINGPALVPTQLAPGQFGGFLGRDYEPMLLGDVTQSKIALPGLVPQDDVPQVRLKRRQALLESLDEYRRTLERDQQLLEMNGLYRQAFELLSRSNTRQAFELSEEPASVRERYGLNRSAQACLLARRLVEAGVPLITVIWNHSGRGQDDHPEKTDFYGWDTHNDIFETLKVHLLPRFDQGFSALIEDLDERGLLDETLVICMGEFGRAPTVALEPRFAGATPGRKHWSSAYSIVMAGAGVGRGRILGGSDRHGAFPVSEHFGPWDVGATIFSALGVNPAGHYLDPLGRPYQISQGRPMAGLYTG